MEKMPEVAESIVDSSTESAFEKLTFSGEDCLRMSCKCNGNEGGKTKCGRRLTPKCSRTDGWHHRKIASHASKSQPFTFRRSKLTFIHSTCLSSGRPVLRSPVLKLRDAVKSSSSPNLIPLTPPVTPLRSPNTVSSQRKPLRDIPNSLLPVLPVPNSISSSVKCCSLGLSDYGARQEEDFKSLAASARVPLTASPSSAETMAPSKKEGGVAAGRGTSSFKDPNYRVFRLRGKKSKKRTPAPSAGPPIKPLSDDEDSRELSKVSEILENTSLTSGLSAGGALPPAATTTTAAAASSSVASSSTSCSQQARMSPSAPLTDITINELAGYFDTFVHIPKKMSQMAEMMYT
ncbi:uncharacterized protein [Hetaerina americana]|uniref:uncharacterized protein n=1 Tax=Hetaerina americana TaxID=62018 RepID=UPI003A7F4CA5